MARTFTVTPAGGAASSSLAVQSAEAGLSPGDEIVFEDGQYHLGRRGLPISRSGTSQQPIIWRARNPGQVVLTAHEVLAGFEHYKGHLWRARLDQPPTMACEDGDPLHHRWEHKFDGPDDPRIERGFWQWFDGFFYVWPWEDDDANNHRFTVAFNSIITISGTASHRLWEGLVFDHCYYGMKWESKDARNHVVRNCLFRNGCEGLGGANDTLIERCTFYNLGPSKWEHGIYDGCENTIIRYNHFEKIAGGALRLYKMPRSITASYNTIGPPMTKRVSFPGQVGIYAWGKGGHQVHHNIIYGGHRIGISVDAPDCVIAHNIIVGTTKWGIWLSKAAQNNIVTNNVLAAADGLLADYGAAPKVLDHNLYCLNRPWHWLERPVSTLDDLRKVSGMEASSRFSAEPPDVGPFESPPQWPARPGVTFDWRNALGHSGSTK